MSSTFADGVRRFAAPILPERLRGERPVVPVVRLQGAIGIGAPFRPALTLASVAATLEKAFAVKGAKEVALVVNSPGGSPVQAHLITKRIRALAAEKEIGVAAFLEDVAASGGYMLACAADEIVADPSSIVGSIGVVSSGFGFDKAIEKLGIDRRLYTSGENKAILDPFQPEKADDVERLKEIQREVHEQFIALVKERRGAALGSHPDLFTGAFWTGATALGRQGRAQADVAEDAAPEAPDRPRRRGRRSAADRRRARDARGAVALGPLRALTPLFVMPGLSGASTFPRLGA